MSEPMSTSEGRCPWCSAVLPDPAADKCPSCGAQLIHASGAEPSVPGVTALDAEAILRARSEAGRSRGGLLGFLTGRDLPEPSGPESPDSLAPPEDAVRREMLRLRFEAEQADAVAESVALKSDVLAERGIHLDQLNGPASAVEAAAADETASADSESSAPDAPGLPQPPGPPAGQHT
jgi:hypothetical protein